MRHYDRLRCYTRQPSERLDPDRTAVQGYSFQIGVAYRCRQLGVSMVELPISFDDWLASKSKVSAGEIHKDFLMVARLPLHGSGI